MPNLNAWVGTVSPMSAWLGDVDRAFDTARLIADKPTEIMITNRSGIGTQTVRLEPLSTTTYDRVSGNVTSTDLRMLVVGYKSLPDYDDTDMQRNDRFVADGQEFVVIQVMPNIPDRFMAIAEATE